MFSVFAAATADAKKRLTSAYMLLINYIFCVFILILDVYNFSKRLLFSSYLILSTTLM